MTFWPSNEFFFSCVNVESLFLYDWECSYSRYSFLRSVALIETYFVQKKHTVLLLINLSTNRILLECSGIICFLTFLLLINFLPTKSLLLQGVVSGTLLVTPNAVMFDPNVSDPLVVEQGAEMYSMIANMENIISAAMYHDIAAMKVKTAAPSYVFFQNQRGR